RKLEEARARRQQARLAMRHFDGLSFKEAAAVLGIEAGAARVRYARAIGRLKDLWLKLGPGESL
ncbi:MAG: sigma factor-like helix-turn-helix DNA-binding protein, partial [Pirellulaceae bacterium]